MKTRDTLKHLYFHLLRLTGSDRRLLRNIRKRDLVVVLNLHQISPESNPFWAPLAPSVFDELLRFLKRNFCVSNFASLDELSNDPRPRAVLSFDDGYCNFVEYAMPILDQHGLTANLNVIPNCIETGEPPWNIKLYDFLNAMPRKLVNEIKLPGFTGRLEDASNDAKVRYGLAISLFLKQRPRRERTELWAEVAKVLARVSDVSTTRMMSAHDVAEAAVSHEIGVHSYSHESMEFEDDEFFQSDFQKCVSYFRDQLRLPLQIYAFPNGSYRPDQITYLDRQGIKRILLVGEGYARRDQKVLPRFTVYGASPAEVSIRALGYNARKGLLPLANRNN
jgi:peptidoglycan/xylan/chitin deacetylase (PgdA/CDA1 family)